MTNWCAIHVPFQDRFRVKALGCTSVHPAQQRARRQRPCTHGNSSPEQCTAPPHAAHGRAEPEEQRRGAGGQRTRAAPLKSRPEPRGGARTQVP